ncbi:leader peptidase (prepilin peptidase)/N-methyltransferase [Nocardia transvalensis]|uniref:Leader peptidase (Prepilin peptidase)/N-methyltransferase n=1 Tax=Nocardia transvalensis TaxID=37333 RepID=A0A7W9PGS8_9NOCA|nr:A24 family peptidase [Nocardia transvalensis]MBB5915792.1 leader peptidase (prepilin peptidase)/N-methyltransferase [Nocardia transvalensis]
MTAGAFGILTAWSAVLSAIDLRMRRLPDPLTVTGAVAILGYAAATGRLLAAVVGAALLAVPYLLVHLTAPAAFGAGDVKLAVGLGAAAACGGGAAWFWAGLAAPLLTAAAGLTAKILRTRRIRAGPADGTVPHGPSMCLATLAALLLTG